MGHAIPNNQPSIIIIWEPSSLSSAQIQSYDTRMAIVNSRLLIWEPGLDFRTTPWSSTPYARSVSPVSYTSSTSIPVLLPRPACFWLPTIWVPSEIGVDMVDLVFLLYGSFSTTLTWPISQIRMGPKAAQLVLLPCQSENSSTHFTLDNCFACRVWLI